MQDYYIGELTESDDEANQFWFRYARPFSIAETNWRLRSVRSCIRSADKHNQEVEVIIILPQPPAVPSDWFVR
jgi:hypothetical protein